MTPRARHLARAAVLPLALMANGCAILSTSSSIRVDVEVYKGPLSREPALQMAELMALWGEFEVSLDGYVAAVCGTYIEAIEKEVLQRVALEPKEKSELVGAQYATCHRAGGVSPAQPKQATQQVASGSDPKTAEVTRSSSRRKPVITPQHCADYHRKANLSTIEAESCFYLVQVYADALDLQDRMANLQSKPRSSHTALFDKGKLTGDGQQFLSEVATLAMHMKFKAYYWALGQVSFPVYDRMIRAVVTNYSTLNSEYANQLSARADALLRQSKESGTSAALMPQSIYLRDSQPTDFLNLYIWNRAVFPALAEDIALHPIESLSSEETTTRVRAFERLYADHYWSRINTVNANGDGEVRMALIKDEIGNWNLKSFDSDPTKLLQAYTSGAISIIEKAVSVSTSGAGPGSATGLLALAGGMAFPGGGAVQPAPGSNAAGADPVAVLNRNAVQRMGKAYSDGLARQSQAAKEEAATRQNASAKLLSAEREPAKELCIEADLPRTDSGTLASRLDLLLSQIVVGVAETRSKPEGAASSAASAQLAKAESAVGEIRSQLAGVAAESDEQKLLCARVLAAKSRLEAASAYIEATVHATRGKNSRERTIADWKAILAEHARAVMALSEAATADTKGRSPAPETVWQKAGSGTADALLKR